MQSPRQVWLVSLLPEGFYTLLSMKEIKLTKGYVALVDDEDYEELSKFKWNAKTAYRRSVYARRVVYISGSKNKTIFMHRQIMCINDPKIQIDHRDGNGLNNQKHNLRKCNNSENQLNTSKRKSKSNYIGLTHYSRNFGIKKWVARICINGKSKFIGLFLTEEEAALARDRYILDNGLEFPTLNILTRTNGTQ